MNRLARHSLCFALFLVISVGNPVIGTASAGKPCPDRDHLIAGLQDARNQLVQGTYRVSGHCVQANLGYGKVDGEISAFSAFDYVRKRSRWDREEPAVFMMEGQATPRRIGLKYVRTPEKTIAFDETAGLGITHIVMIFPPNREAPKIALPFDVRSFGLMGWSSVQDGSTFDAAMERLEASPFTEIRRGAEGLCELTVELRPDVRKKLWIDCERGYTISRAELQAFSKPKNEWLSGMEVAEIKWDQLNSVWVPTSMHLERSFGEKEIYSIKLDWVSVNEEPDPKLFEPNGLGLDPQFSLADGRAEKTVVIGRLGGADLNPPQRNPASSRNLYVWIGCALIAMLAIVSWWTRRSR